MKTRKLTSLLLLLAATVVIIFIYHVYKPRDENIVTMIDVDKNVLKNTQKAIQSPQKHVDTDVIKDTQNIQMSTHSVDSELVVIIQNLKSQGKPLLVTMINDAYIPFAHSWLCNTLYMGVHEQVLIIVTDTKSQDVLYQQWPNIHVIALLGDDLHGNQDYSHAGYVRIMVKRTEFLLKILKLEIEIFLFELDAYWLTNPVPETQKQVEGYDIVVIPVSQRPGIISGGFLYMKPTDKMISLWTKLTEMMNQLDKKIRKLNEKKAISEGDNDQMYLSGLISKKYSGIRVTQMPLNKFPDGHWYTMKEKDKKKTLPLVIQNNWVIGNKAKINRAKSFKHWFWDSEAKKCNTDLVKEKTKS